jgi:hypothetical protein
MYVGLEVNSAVIDCGVLYWLIYVFKGLRLTCGVRHFYEENKNALCGGYVCRSVCLSLTSYQRLNRLLDFVKFGIGILYKYFSSKCCMKIGPLTVIFKGVSKFLLVLSICLHEFG